MSFRENTCKPTCLDSRQVLKMNQNKTIPTSQIHAVEMHVCED